MKIKTLIAILKTLPEDAEVGIGAEKTDSGYLGFSVYKLPETGNYAFCFDDPSWTKGAKEIKVYNKYGKRIDYFGID